MSRGVACPLLLRQVSQSYSDWGSRPGSWWSPRPPSRGATWWTTCSVKIPKRVESYTWSLLMKTVCTWQSSKEVRNRTVSKGIMRNSDETLGRLFRLLNEGVVLHRITVKESYSWHMRVYIFVCMYVYMCVPGCVFPRVCASRVFRIGKRVQSQWY